MKIGIVGCGIGGLAVGAFLAQGGRDVTLFDQFKTAAPVGSGLIIQPVGQAVLNLLGAGQYVRKMAAPISQMHGVEADSGKRVLNVGYNETHQGLGVHRATLFEGLLQVARRAGVRIITDAKVETSKLVDEKRVILFEDGGMAGPFDLVIDASGASSPLSPLQAKSLSYGALWGVVDTPTQTSLPTDVLSQCYRKSSSMVGVLPIGYLPGDPNHKTALFWSLRVDAYDQWRAQPIGQWREQAVKLWPESAPFVHQITDHKDMAMARYSHGNLRNPVAERLVFIGDAAHRASPQLGQGANMALLDALVLAEAIGRLDLGNALQEYALVRRWHVRVYQMISWAFTPMYQSDSAIMPLIRDWVLSPATYVPPVPALLRHLVCGVFVPPGLVIQKALDLHN